MKRLVFAAAASALLASCGTEAEESTDGADAGGEAASGDLSMAEVAERAEAASVKPQPGLYRSQVELVDADIPGAPAQAMEMMRGMMDRSFEYCLTPEEAEGGYEQMADQSQEGDCSFQKFDIDGGDIDAAMTCDGGGGPVSMTMQGTGTETSADFTMSMKGNMGGTGEGSMTIRAQHERIGECEG